MPQVIVSRTDKGIVKKLKGLLRFFSSRAAKTLWPLIPRKLYFNHFGRVSIALTRKCNAACVFCAYQFLENQYKKSMSDEIFEIVVQELKKNAVKEVMLSPDLGEPLLAPNIVDKIKAIRKAGVKTIELTTNGILLDKTIGVEDFLEYIDIINISFAGFDEGMYKRVYGVSKYQDVRRSILELLLKNSKRTNPKWIRVWLRGDIEVAYQLSFPEIDIVKKHANELAVMTEVDSWNGKITQEMLTGTMKLQTEAPKISRRPCAILLFITIHPDGSIHACSCRNVNNDQDLYLGNIKEVDIRTAYNNVTKIFDKWKEGYIPLICQSCCMYNDPANSILGVIKGSLSKNI